MKTFVVSLLWSFKHKITLPLNNIQVCFFFAQAQSPGFLVETISLDTCGTTAKCSSCCSFQMIDTDLLIVRHCSSDGVGGTVSPGLFIARHSRFSHIIDINIPLLTPDLVSHSLACLSGFSSLPLHRRHHCLQFG